MVFYLQWVLWSAATTVVLIRLARIELGLESTTEERPRLAAALVAMHLAFTLFADWDELSVDRERTAAALALGVAVGLLAPSVLRPLFAWLGRRLRPTAARLSEPADAVAALGADAGRAVIRRIEPHWPRLSEFQLVMLLILIASLVVLAVGLGPLLLR